AKMFLLALTMPLAYANKETNVPALRDQTREASVNLRRYVVLEIAIVVTIIAVTTALVYSTPPRESGSASLKA
ncbi:MAG TPA: hypothetical protein VNM48_00845, partial [Chloroflexota bacterium]|nr:hypothetical protein [Chloroflexota bacterium]